MSDFTWLNPVGLWAAAFLPGIVLLYFLKLKRRRVVVPSTLLWRRAVNDSRANAPLQRLRTNLLLLLQLLMAALVAFALGKPAFMAAGKSASATVIVLDASASMAASDVRPTRFAQAQQIALEHIDALGSNAQAMVVIAGPRPRVASPFERNRRVLRDAIEGAEPAAAPADLGGALQLALAASEGRIDREIVIISDGAFEPPAGLRLKDVPVVFERVGKTGGNVGIVALDVRLQSVGTRQGFFTVVNDGDAPVDVEVEITQDGSLIDVRPLTIPAGSESSDVFGLKAGEGGILRLQVTPGGTLAADDQAYVALPARGDLRVALGGNTKTLLKRALEADERLEVTDITLADATQAATENDIVVFHRESPAVLPPGRWLLLDPPDGAGIFNVGPVVEDPGAVDADDQHPLARYAQLATVHIGRQRQMTIPPGARIIAETERGGPLLWTYNAAGRRLVVWSGELFASDLPLRPAFPILLANSIEYLCAGCGSGARAVRAGEVFRGEVPVGIEEVTIASPDGESFDIPVTEGEYLFERTERIGVYEVRYGSDKEARSRFAVNLLSRAESNTVPRSEIKLTSGTATATVVQAGEEQRRRRTFWRPLVIFAAVILTIEWLVWILREGIPRRRPRKTAERAA